MKKNNKLEVKQPDSERDGDSINSSSAVDITFSQTQKIKGQKCSRLKTISLYLLAIGTIILAVLLWSQEKELNKQLSKQLDQVNKRLEQSKKNNTNQGQQVKQLQTKILQIQQQYDTHLKNQKTVKSQPQTQKPTAKTAKEAAVEKVKPQPVEKPKQESSGKTPKEEMQIGYIVNEKLPQEGGIKLGHQGTISAIKLLSKNALNQSIDEVLYKTPNLIAARKEFHEERKRFMEKYRHFDRLNLVLFNNKIDNRDDDAETRQLNLAYAKADQIHKISQYKEELPFCILIPSYKNNARFRIQYNLNSIFTQNYTNYYAVITNDASDDGSDEVYRNYFRFYQIPSNKYIYINNPTKKGAMENDYNANHNYCSQDAISLHLDGDDQLIGKNVLKIFNAEYQRRKAGALYSNFYFFSQNRFASPGFTSEFPDFVKKQNQYKSHPMRYSHLKTYRTELFRRLDKSNFLDSSGKFVGFASDVAIYLPIMEVSCQRVYKIEGFHYLYNTQTGNNEDTISRAKQVQAEYIARGKPSLKCDQQFRKKMQSIP